MKTSGISITMDKKTILARIDLLGLGISDTAKYVLDMDVILSMNQAIIALEDAFKRLSRGVKDEGERGEK